MKIFKWIYPSTWHYGIEPLCNLNDSGFTEPILYDFSNLAELLQEPIFLSIMNSFWDKFQYIEVYHASKPDDPQIIHQQGLLLRDHLYLLKKFRDLFINDVHKINENDLENSLQLMDTKTEENCINVVIDYRHIIEMANHYLIFGSEFIQGLVIHLPNFRDELIDVLLERGIPTLFKIHLPLSYLTNKDKAYLFQKIISEFKEVKNNNYSRSCYSFHTFTFEREIPYNYIVSHFHPNNIVNSHFSNYGPRIFKSKKRCEMCN
ncbi:MAG: hypothetical protein CVV49_21805 [Spirochaetae bacterium HGW-Spirochaetae-5]|nr:MAG: hypothetical protein CVV49_21805 [Spirochaetae bacterium HGW-Spirochaetae-5]